jgi:hypothetical protein
MQAGTGSTVGGDGDALTEQQLLELFKETSTFTVRSALKPTDGFQEQDGFGAGPDGLELSDDDFSDEEECVAPSPARLPLLMLHFASIRFVSLHPRMCLSARR